MAAVERSDQRLTDRANRVTKSCTRSLDQAGTQLAVASTRLGRRGLQLAAQELQTLIQIEARVRLLDPVHTLARGWSLTRTADGRVIRSTADLAVGDTIVTTLADGQARSAIAAIQAAPTPPQSQGDAP